MIEKQESDKWRVGSDLDMLFDQFSSTRLLHQIFRVLLKWNRIPTVELLYNE